MKAWEVHYLDSDNIQQKANAKARCESIGGKMGESKCYKDGREI